MIPSDVRKGLENLLKEGLTGVNTYDLIPDVLIAPCAFIGQLIIDFDAANARGLDHASVDVALVVSRTSDQIAQKQLDGWLGGTDSKSIKTILESDRTAQGSLSTLRVISATPGEYQNNGISYLAYKFRLDLYG